jgi:hypothetical protein
MWPPYHVVNAMYGRPSDTVIFFFAYTPTGRVSKYWASFTINYSLRDKTERLRRYMREQRPRLSGKLKGYRWSSPYLYSGNTKEWENFKEEDIYGKEHN